MLINLVKTVICFYLCFSVTNSYIYNRNSDRTPKNQYPKIVSPYHDNSNNYKQSRYSKFDKVMTRINKLIVEDDVSSDGVYKIRHKGWSGRKPVSTTPSTTTTTEMDLFETYGELENEDEFDDYEDTLDDDDDDDELEYADEDDDDPDSDPFFDSLDEDIQAEEPTEKPSSTAMPRIVSKLTEYKWNHYGTKEKVEESRRQQLTLTKDQLERNAAIDHFARVNKQSKCLTPLPRVISVQQEHPDPTKTYLPACTILHRCAEDSGCCSRNSRCQNKTTEIVSLYFYATSVGQDHSTTIERLDFYNDTKCECGYKTKYVPLESEKSNHFTAKSLIDQNLTSENTNPRCNCTKPFQPFVSSQKCTCDCDKSDQDCIILKKGKEHFSLTNRICIQNNECDLPSCEYGSYRYKDGKCPSKQDKLEEFRETRIYNRSRNYYGSL